MTVERRSQAELPLHALKGRLAYDAETGVFTALVSGGRKAAGTEAGYVNNQGYRLIWLHGHYYLAHRLAWYYSTGTWPVGEIDHINGNPSDNRIANLRLATRSQNVANAKVNPLNTTGFRGVCRVPRARGGDRFQAAIRVNGRAVYLGTFTTPEEAHKAYLYEAEKVYGAFLPHDSVTVHAERAPEPKQEALGL